MEDPWGSPWASADTSSDNHPSPSSQANLFLSPPPRAFFGSTMGLSAQVAWSENEGDGLGILATANRADVADKQSDWGIWGESGVQPPRLSPRLGGSGKRSPLAWPENTTTSPVLMARSRSRTSSIYRHRSPDPWATEPSWTNCSETELQSSPQPTANDTPTTEIRPIEEPPQRKKNIETDDTTGSSVKREGGALNRAGASEENLLSRTSCDMAGTPENTSFNPSIAVGEPSSPPSSTFSLDSQDGPDRQDSPITLIDEDQGSQPHNKLPTTLDEKPELEDLEDVMATTASWKSPNIGRLGILRTQDDAKSTSTSEAEHRSVAKDLKNALVNNDMAAQPSNDASTGMASTPKAELIHEDGGDHISVTETQLVRAQDVVNNFANITFDTNLKLVEKLFPDLADSLEISPIEDCCEIPKHIVNDSFMTISERKAWYRISRFGSMRKHNSGDDENFFRVSWPTSELHNDTIKIVRRWMEQDLCAGRTIFGGAKRTGFFDWDSDAAPVELDEVFRRKNAVTKHARTTSIPAYNEAARQSRPEERQYRNSTGITFVPNLRPASPTNMPISSFDWMSEPRVSIPPITQPSHRSSQPPTPVRESEPVPFLPRPPTSIQTTFTNEDEDEDDDDWGEMVSSPHVTTNPVQQPSAAASPSSATTTTNRNSVLQLSLAMPFDITESVELEPPSPLATQSTPINPSSPSQNSVPDGLKNELSLPIVHDSELTAYFTALNDAAPLDLDSSQIWNQSSIVGSESPSKNTITVETPASEVLPTSVLTIDATTAPDSANLPGNESHDHIIIQDILRNIPDLSYMLR
ncbi:hypothetical protein GGS21DRAFT_519300 [Xylaria nigripes]|nr:hypothetical protein GGS21DRAFT_519300 [Xylaria nigripes]